MGTYRSRLRKVFFFFAAKDSGSHRHMDIREFLFMLKVRAQRANALALMAGLLVCGSLSAPHTEPGRHG